MAGRRAGPAARREVTAETRSARHGAVPETRAARREAAKDTSTAGDSVRSLASVFRALADETRLHMLALLRATPELCVCDLAAVLDLTHSKASRHLRYLAVRGLVTESRRRTWAYYRWNTDATDDAAAALRAVRPILLDERFAALQNRLRTRLASRAKDDAACAPAPGGSRTSRSGAASAMGRVRGRQS